MSELHLDLRDAKERAPVSTSEIDLYTRFQTSQAGP